MMRVLGLVLLASLVGGCTSVKMVQRDGCWVKRTEKIFGRVHEEVGPCKRPQPSWVQDQLTRLVQECVAQADYRWQGRALEAWSKGKAYPAQPPEEEVLRTCMQEARVGLVNENDELKRRVADLTAERERLRAETEREQAHLRASTDRIAGYLGEAAQRPAGTATATASATSDGKATNESGTTLATESTPAIAWSGAPSPGAPAVPTTPVATTPVPAPPSTPTAPAPATPAAPTAAPPSPSLGAAASPARPPKIARARRAPARSPPRAAECRERPAGPVEAAPCPVPSDESPRADAPKP